MYKTWLIVLITLSIQEALSSPCNEIVFEYTRNNKVRVLNAPLIIQWKYNLECSGQKLRSNRFVIEITTLFGEETLLIDTVSEYSYWIDPSNFHYTQDLVVFHLREIDSDRKYSLGLHIENFDSIISENLIVNLNDYLLNGYFLNAHAVIKDLSIHELVPKISEQFDVLFPPNYPEEHNFFNSYYSEETDKFIRMPYAKGLDQFVKILNKRTKDEYLKGDPFTILCEISPDNLILSMRTEPSSFKENVSDLIRIIEFQNPNQQNSIVVIKVGKTANGKKYQIANERALINPNSKKYRTTYPYRGAIH